MNTAYLILKTANSLYGKRPGDLAQSEFAKVERLATRQYELESRVLVTPEAKNVVVPDATLASALAEVRSRYDGEDEFLEDLAGNGLSLHAFTAALERELKVETVLDKIGSQVAQVSDIDLELYYEYHKDQFRVPERRVARHILVTLNEDIPENTAAVARERIEAIAARLVKNPDRFEEQAIKHSECPTALQGGALGEIRRGQLFAELDAALFELGLMQISPIVESPLGLHILRCDNVIPANTLALPMVMDSIRDLLIRRRKVICQKAWLKQMHKTNQDS